MEGLTVGPHGIDERVEVGNSQQPQFASQLLDRLSDVVAHSIAGVSVQSILEVLQPQVQVVLLC